MREFLLGMWLAIALVVAGPATWSFAADKSASDDKAAAAEKKADDKETDKKSADEKSDAKADADKKADDADEKAEAKDEAKIESKRVKAKKAEAARAAEKAKAEEQAKKDKEAADKEAAAKAAKKKVRIAYIIVDGALPESPGEMSLFGDLGVDLRKTMARIEKAGDDESIAGVILQIDAAPGRGKLNELRDSIKRVQSKGKKVYALLESAMGPQYQLASACDEIIIPESGEVLLPGVRAEFSFYKDLLGKVGVEADMLHVGDFKGAAEPYTRDSLSEPVRKNMTALIDDVYDEMLTTIASDRDLKVEEVRLIVDQGLLMANEAKEAGLVDRIAYPDQFRDSLQKEYKADKLVYVENYAKQKVDADFSGPMGMMKLFQSMMGEGKGGSGDSNPKIAIVYAVGPIMSGKSQSSILGETTMGSTTIVEALQEAAKDETVKAIVLRVDSPGGSALASDLIWRQTQAIDKPIVASMGDVAASGGYYISMGADRIFAEPGTVTGSIGVVGGKLAMKGVYDKLGIDTESISRGENSGIFSTTHKFSDSERKVVERMMKDVYRQFTTKAAEGRKMKVEQLEKLAGGQVYTGRVAKRLGLIDEVGTLRDSIQSAKRLAGLDPDKKVEVLVLPKPENPFEAMFGGNMDAEREAEARVIAGITSLAPELRGVLRHAVQLRQVMREPVAVMMPYWFEIK
ncbi:signal peptide peptidase SppA [Lacipirellula parvula]|uniref:Signal peptide peptidase SppA n=1 Tax=Lacipirellula parvula TaxID=2650471 RepID=A0A5K7X8N2_9BACT|nr:signal peptide peptidase SppA [Lacipirellula parvula]BBO32232.1 signal peptide peptidase SppA [Lacipirellula parvula]